MTTETLSQELQQAFEVYKTKNPAAKITVEDSGSVTVWRYGTPSREQQLDDREFFILSRYDFKNQEAAIPFLVGELIPFRVNRVVKWLQDDHCTVLAQSHEEAKELAEKATEWTIDYPLQPEETDIRYAYTEQEHENENRGIPQRKYDNVLLFRAHNETVGIDLDRVEVLNGDEYNFHDETPKPATDALALVPPTDGAAAVFQDIDRILDRHASGDSTAKSDLQLLATALRLKIALMKFKQAQDDRKR